MVKLNELFTVLCEDLNKDKISFAKNLFMEIGQLDTNMLNHTLSIARRIVSVIEYKLNEKELAETIIKTYKDNYKNILQLVNHKADPEAEALARIVVLVVNHKNLSTKECEIRVIPREFKIKG